MEDFEQWVAARRGVLARTAYLPTGDVHLAEDLVQETLARVAQKWRRLARDEAYDAYARTTMHHLAIDRWRRRRAHPELGDGGPDIERRLVLRDALSRLTPEQRAVLSLRFYDDLTEAQTAAVLGCSVSTVKSQSRAALDRLPVLAPDLLGSLTEETRS